MKEKETYERCEYCDALLRVCNPPTEEAYEQGRISVSGNSRVLLSDAIVRRKYQNPDTASHAEDFSGVYCNWNCLTARLKDILGIKACEEVLAAGEAAKEE